MLSEARREISCRLAALPVTRKPALRRSDAAGFTLATDLPLCADDQTVAAFIGSVSEAGCRVSAQGGWLLLDPPIPCSGDPAPVPLTGLAPVLCLISLLERHPDPSPAPDIAETVRRLARADDAGTEKLLRLCEQLHREWAVSLRLHQPLPSGLLPWLYDLLRRREISPC